MVTAWRACLAVFQMVNMSWKSRSTRPCRIERRGLLNKSRQRRARTQQEEESHIMQQQM
jgi:anti-sigma-K factor RskA